MFTREPIFHDRQTIFIAGPIVTTETEFVNIPGAKITTKDLGSPADYQGWMTVSVENTNNNSVVSFRVIIDEVATEDREIRFGPNAANNPQTITLSAEGSDINLGADFQIQWKTSVGTATINDLRIMIDGIPDHRVVKD